MTKPQPLHEVSYVPNVYRHHNLDRRRNHLDRRYLPPDREQAPWQNQETNNRPTARRER
jgi:hypothetical protein